MKIRNAVFYILVLILLLAALYLAVDLSLKEARATGACPSIGPVPACYVVTVGFLLGLAGHLGGRFKILRVGFVFGMGLCTFLALFASIGEIGGFLECPRMLGNIPMCYASLLFCILIWGFWSRGGRYVTTPE